MYIHVYIIPCSMELYSEINDWIELIMAQENEDDDMDK